MVKMTEPEKQDVECSLLVRGSVSGLALGEQRWAVERLWTSWCFQYPAWSLQGNGRDILWWELQKCLTKERSQD